MSASLQAQVLPIKLMAITSTTIVNPGGIHNHGCFVSTVRDCAPFSILPRLADGGWIPVPRKLNAASSSMDKARTDVAYTKIGAAVFGRISKTKYSAAASPPPGRFLQNYSP